MRTFKPCPSYPGYSVSADGVVLSHRLGGRGAGIWPHINRRLKPRLDRDGYQVVALSDGVRAHTIAVHAVMLDAFSGPRPAGHEGRHLDGDKLHNHITNLCWGTKLENAADRDRHGRQYRGERHPQAKLTYEIAAQIRRLASQGRRHVDLAAEFGISTGLVSYVRRGLRWVQP